MREKAWIFQTFLRWKSSGSYGGRSRSSVGGHDGGGCGGCGQPWRKSS